MEVPTHFTYSITTSCPLRCTYCYEHFQNYTPQPARLDVAKALVDFAIERARETGKKPSIHFFGGEPLAAWDVLKEAVLYARAQRKDFHFGLTSNLVLLDDEMAEFLAKHNVSVLASIDGVKEVHDANRIDSRGRGSFDRVMRSVEVLKRHGVRWSIRGTFTDETVSRFYDSYRFLLSLGASAATLLPAYEGNWNEENLRTYESELTRLAAWWVQEFRRGRVHQIKQFNDGLRALVGPKGSKRPCGLGDRALGVNPDGSFRPCHRLCTVEDIPEEWKLGDVFRGVDMEKWRRSVEWDPRKLRSQDPSYDCSMCPLYWSCTGQCIAANWQATGSRYIVMKSICDLNLVDYRVAALIWGILRHDQKFIDWLRSQGIAPRKEQARPRCSNLELRTRMPRDEVQRTSEKRSQIAVRPAAGVRQGRPAGPPGHGRPGG